MSIRYALPMMLLCGACAPEVAAESTGGSTVADSGGTTATTDDVPTTANTEGPGDGGWRRICDGSVDLTLAMRGVGHEGVNTMIAHELGIPFLYVRGDCRYWVVDAFPETLTDWKVARTGTLTLEREEQLSRALHFDRWGELAGLYDAPGNPGGYERQYSDGVSTIRCELNCSTDVDAPQEVMDLTAVSAGWFASLWEAAEPLAATAPMRVDIVRVELPEPIDNPCFVEWPFPLPPGPLSRDMDTPLPWSSRLIEDAAMASQLRALREQYITNDLPDGTCNPVLGDGPMAFFEASAPHVAYSLWTRDAVPLQQPGSGIPLPGLL